MSGSFISPDVQCQQTVAASRSRRRSLGSAADLRTLFAGQAKLLAARAEAGLPIDVRSLLNLVRAYRALVVAEARRA
jgi:hypothetical protein